MYNPMHFQESRPEVLAQLMHAHPLATLICNSASGLVANHIPMHFASAGGPHGRLVAHVARANPLWQETITGDVLAVFQGPQQYITPSWYQTKKDTGKVVPTWNYAVVHAHGKLIIHDDAAWVRDLLEKLTQSQEAPRARPWHVADAPEEFVSAQMRAIVGIELAITRLEGKWKVSQNRSTPDREGVIRGLRGESSDRNSAMAELVEEAMFAKKE